LLRAAAFPHEAIRLDMIETHISWVILAGDYAYKIKKPVDLGFLDFSTLELRRHFCAEELRLNRRFAPSLYLDVVAIGGSEAHPVIGQEPAIEWAVRMHRFPADAGLDRQVPEGRVSAHDLHQFGETLALIHTRADVSSDPAYGTPASIMGPALDNFTSIERDCLDDPRIRAGAAELRDWTMRAGEALAPLFDERARAGRIRECHGDLHLGNIVRVDDACMAFDCLEFDPALRWIDVISDVGFLVMDLWRVGRADFACAFLNRYLEVSNDYPGLATLPFYGVYRALVRAKTTAVRIAQQRRERADGPDHDLAAVEAYLEVAGRIARPPAAPVLVICHGLSGSGKTWVSDGLIAELPAIRVRSDVVRKHLHGLEELEHGGAGLNVGMYGKDATAATYEQVAANAAAGLRAGMNVIVDATFLRRAARQRLLEVADAAGAAGMILHCEASRAALEARIRARQAGAADASEADIDVLREQLRSEEPLTAAETDRTVVVDTEREVDFCAIAAALRGGPAQQCGKD